MPYLRETALWPVLIAILGHVWVVVALVLLGVWRDTAGAVTWAVLIGLGLGSLALVVTELRLFRRPGGMTAVVLGSWLASGVIAYASEVTGVL